MYKSLDQKKDLALDIERHLAPLVKRIEALEAAQPRRKWDEGEHEGCGIDSQRAVERAEQPQRSQEAREKEITRLATIEECAKVAESYPSSGEQTEHPVEYWIRRLSLSRPDRERQS